VRADSTSSYTSWLPISLVAISMRPSCTIGQWRSDVCRPGRPAANMQQIEDIPS
jgi:hypothetical protein